MFANSSETSGTILLSISIGYQNNIICNSFTLNTAQNSGYFKCMFFQSLNHYELWISIKPVFTDCQMGVLRLQSPCPQQRIVSTTEEKVGTDWEVKWVQVLRLSKEHFGRRKKSCQKWKENHFLLGLAWHGTADSIHQLCGGHARPTEVSFGLNPSTSCGMTWRVTPASLNLSVSIKERPIWVVYAWRLVSSREQQDRTPRAAACFSDSALVLFWMN